MNYKNDKNLKLKPDKKANAKKPKKVEKKTEQEIFEKEMQQKGPNFSLSVLGLQEQVKSFQEIWSDKDSFSNEIDPGLIAQETLPQLEEKVREKADQNIKRELDNFYFKLGLNRKREKKQKKKKKGKTKPKRIPGEKLVHTNNPVDLLPPLIETNILQRCPQVTFEDFVATDNVLR